MERIVGNLLIFLALLGLESIAFGQSASLSIGSGSGTPGGTVALPINLAPSGSAQTAGLQWTFSFSSNITNVTVAAGASAVNAGKSVSCFGNNCLVVGLNSNVIASGLVAIATFQIASNSSSTTIPIQITGVVASTAGGAPISASGSSGTISLPGPVALSGLSCTNTTLNTPASTACVLSLTAAAPAGGFPVLLSSNNANLTVPGSVTVLAGQTAVNFTSTAAQVSTNQNAVVTASAGSVNLTNSLNLVPPVQLTSLTCAPSTLGSNASSTCTVSLDQNAAALTAVSLSSNNALVTVPASVSVQAGQSTATFAATTGTVSSGQSVTITASLNGQSQPATLSLAAATQLSSLSCSPATVSVLGTATCTVSLTAGAPSGGATVALSSSNANVSVPGNATIPAGQNSTTFSATVGAVSSNQNAILTATLNSASQTFTLAISAPQQLTSLVCAPSTLGSNASSTCTVSLNQNAAAITAVSLSSNNALVAVPANVSVQAGQSSTTFSATTGTVSSSQNATVTASLNGVTQPVTLSLAATVQLSNLSCSPATVNAPGTATCTVSLTAGAPSGGATITLSGNNAIVSVPGSATIPAGQNSTTFDATVGAVNSNQNATLTATLNSASQTFILNISAPTVPLTSFTCAPMTLGSNMSSTCTVSLIQPVANTTSVSLTSDNASVSIPASVSILAGQSNATFAAATGTLGSSQNAVVRATSNGQSQSVTLSLMAANNCAEFQLSPDGRCMVQDLIPWVVFGSGWESRLKMGNIPSGSAGGPIQANFNLIPALQTSNGIQNHMSAYFTDDRTLPLNSLQLGESASYTLQPGESADVHFLYGQASCDVNGQNCAVTPDPNTLSFGSLLLQYFATDPAYLRGLAKAQVTFLELGADGSYVWESVESEMPPAPGWWAPAAVTANKFLNPQANQDVSAAIANPGASAVTVTATLYDEFGQAVTNKNLVIPARGVIAFAFSSNQQAGGFGRAMFPNGEDYNGWVNFEVVSPSDAAVSVVVFQWVGNSMSTVSLQSSTHVQGQSASLTSVATSCAEFQVSPDGRCMVQNLIPWVAFGGGWESRLKIGNIPSVSAGGPIQVGFKLLPASAATNGIQNHIPAYFADNRSVPSGRLQLGESSSYSFQAGESVDVRFLYPPAGCDIHGENCGGTPDATKLSYGSLLVQYFATEPASLRGLAKAQVTFLERAADGSYGWQSVENEMPSARSWKAPAAVTADKTVNPQANQEASATIANPGALPVTVQATLYDQFGSVVTGKTLVIPALSAVAFVFSSEGEQQFGGFGQAMFPQGADYNGWVTFEVVSPNGGTVSVVVLQWVGASMSTVSLQSSQ